MLIAQVVVAGKGISVDIELETVSNSRSRVFKINHVTTHCDTLSFAIRDSKHDLLYKVSLSRDLASGDMTDETSSSRRPLLVSSRRLSKLVSRLVSDPVSTKSTSNCSRSETP
jgi:hypothetical protein